MKTTYALPLVAAGALAAIPTIGRTARGPRERTLPLSLESTLPLPFGHPLDVAATPSLLCVANGAGGLLVYDVNEPLRPKVLSRYLPAGSSEGPEGEESTAVGATAVALYGQLCYLVWKEPTGSQVHLLSLADPAHPKLLGSLKLDQPAAGVHALSESRVLITASAAPEAGAGPMARPALFLGEFADPAHPVVLSSWRLAPGEGDHLDRLSFAAETAVVCGNDNGIPAPNGSLQVLGYSDPGKPELLSTVRTHGPALDVAITRAGVAVYVACGTSGVNYFDISDRAAPRFLGSLDTHGAAALRVVLVGTHLYVLTPTDVLRYEVSTPLRPRRVPSAPNGLAASGLAAADGFVACFARERGIDLRRTDTDGLPKDGSVIRCVGSQPQLHVTGDHVLVALGDGGLWSVDYSRPKAPTRDGDFIILPSAGRSSRVLDAVPVGEHNMWLSAAPGGLVVSPLRGDFSARLGLAGPDDKLIRLAGREKQVIAVSPEGSLRVFDAADAHRPLPLGRLDLKLGGGAVRSMAILDNIAVLAAGHELIACSLSDPNRPSERVRRAGAPSADYRDVAFDAGHLFALDAANGLTALDLPASGPPVPLGQAGEPGARRLAVQQGLACMSGGRAGLTAMDVRNPAAMEPLAVRAADLAPTFDAAWLPPNRKEGLLLVAGPGWLRCYRVRFPGH